MGTFLMFCLPTTFSPTEYQNHVYLDMVPMFSLVSVCHSTHQNHAHLGVFLILSVCPPHTYLLKIETIFRQTCFQCLACVHHLLACQTLKLCNFGIWHVSTSSQPSEYQNHAHLGMVLVFGASLSHSYLLPTFQISSMHLVL